MLTGGDSKLPDGRDETTTERLDRNWADILQELRVIQTGVQFLTGFLLTLPFQARFTAVTTTQHNAYLATVSASITATALLQAPVSVHRGLFQRHERARTVHVAHRLAMLGMGFLGLAIAGVAFEIFAVAESTPVGATAAAITAALLLALWSVLPTMLRRSPHHSDVTKI